MDGPADNLHSEKVLHDLAQHLAYDMTEDNPDLIEEYQKQGGDINYEFRTGSTHLHHMAYWGFINCVKKLIELGADIDYTNDKNFTPLHQVINRPTNDFSSSHIEIIQFLLEKGADLTIGDDSYDEDPLALATRLGYTKIIELIENHIANQNMEAKSAGKKK